MTAKQMIPPVQAAELLRCPHHFTIVQLDLQLLEKEINLLGEANVIAQHLSAGEQEQASRLSLAKRKLEWLAGRFAAKYAAASLLLQDNALTKIAGKWYDFRLGVDENGRPFLSASKGETTNMAFPDISISHSGSMAVAMAVSRGYCGIDIQNVTPRVVKVRDRFCTPAEQQVLLSSFQEAHGTQTAPLTALWAAKEALRKSANLSSLPGFLELELAEVRTAAMQKKTGPWSFVFHWKHSARHGPLVFENRLAAVTLAGDYALALTTVDGTPA